MVEQILSAHPRISAGDELPLVEKLSNAIQRLFSSPLGYPESLAELWMAEHRDGLDVLRDHYLYRARQMGAITPGSEWFTDKMPLNETHLGLISLVFPRSPLIHLQRHPLDVVLSVFANHMTHGFFCGYELETAARHFVLVSDLMEHYERELQPRLLRVRYESLVQDLEEVLSGLVPASIACRRSQCRFGQAASKMASTVVVLRRRRSLR